MLQLLSFTNIAKQGDLFISQFQLRQREFIDRQNYDVVDRLFQVAELRLGEKPQAIVRITATTTSGGRHD